LLVLDSSLTGKEGYKIVAVNVGPHLCVEFKYPDNKKKIKINKEFNLKINRNTAFKFKKYIYIQLIILLVLNNYH